MTAEQMTAVNNALNPGIQLALPQTVVPVWKTQHQVASTQYDPAKLAALKSALTASRSKQQIAKDKWEMLGNALATNMSSPTYEGAYGVKFTNPLTDALVGSARTFSDLYGGFKQQERDLANQDVELQNLAREDAIKAAQLEAEASKQAITDQIAKDYIKFNDPKAAEADMSYRFEPERIKELKELNDNAGRWATQWEKGQSDIWNTEASRSYNEFEGKAKQYVQDQLKKIYGAQMTEAEGERFFKSMGLSPQLDPELRWRLVENALDDLARKSGKTIKEPVVEQPTNINGFIIEEVK